MFCKQGDLAIIVKSYAGNEGKIVRCVRPATPHMIGPEALQPRWQVDCLLITNKTTLVQTIADRQLRPIRDTDGVDETLREEYVTTK